MFTKRSKVLNSRKATKPTNKASKEDEVSVDGSNSAIGSERIDHTSYFKDTLDKKAGFRETEKSFRRGIRDGTIINQLSDDEPVINISHKYAKNLSFTDSLLEDESTTIRIRKSKMSKFMTKKRKKGVCMTTSDTEPLNSPLKIDQIQEKHPETNYTSDISEEYFDAQSSLDLDNSDTNHELEDIPNNTRNTYDENNVEITMEPEEMDMEADLRKILADIHEEYRILNDSVDGNQKLIGKNTEKLEKTMADIDESKKELTTFNNLLDLTRALAGFIHENNTNLEHLIRDAETYRIERMEETYRLRRWLYCDFLRNAGFEDVDYKCGDLEDVDDYGHERFQGIKCSFNARGKAIGMSNTFYENSIKRAQSLASKLRGRNLKDYLSRDVINCFIPEFEVEYTLDDLIVIYDSQLGGEDYPDEIRRDTDVSYLSIGSAIEQFLKFKDTYPNEFEEFDMANNLIRVIKFYAGYSLASCNLLGDEKSNLELYELEWFKICSLHSRASMPEILYETVFPAVITSIEYWDIESHRQSSRLSSLLSFILHNTDSKHRSSIAEKATSSLIKVIESRLSVSCIKLRAEFITDRNILNLIKYQLLNINSNLVLFSTFLSPVTLAKFTLDNIFVSKLLPLLSFDSPFDAFVVLQFMAAISKALGKHLEIKTKTNSIVKSACNRFKECVWNYKTSCTIFKTLEVPINIAAYVEAINY
ncbi:conserved hypothetical protein [Theileria equi strain WA]|uniref:GCF C-terminal domain-containing protein n=1 Tax=Theileria equi strain WA TaxID=1537102 RepID=L1LCJ1_THEEQ|nr:conserved hypothetical protein [Theileria equi strain WA]EKX73157.1 conserved hypothetical protein [Theileria equi strain WA]|eukprot:XP_004832609.1 conserved hypothetical protein [Theileria equi strain WA]